MKLESENKFLKLAVRIIFLIVLFSCAKSEELKKESHPTINKSSNYLIYTDSVVELSTEQQIAFDALDFLQVNSDEPSRMYSTYPNTPQSCYPPDSIFTISQATFLTVMEQFVSINYTNLTKEKRKELIKIAVLAQEKYRVLHCLTNISESGYKNGLPLSGTWVIPNVLGHRDILIEWR